MPFCWRLPINQPTTPFETGVPMAKAEHNQPNSMFSKKWEPLRTLPPELEPKPWCNDAAVLYNVDRVTNPVYRRKIRELLSTPCVAGASVRGFGRRRLIHLYSKMGMRDVAFVRALVVSARYDTDFNVSFEALVELRKMFVEHVFDDLVMLYGLFVESVCSVLATEGSWMRQVLAADILGQIGDQTVLPFLEKALLDKDYRVRLFVQYAIAQIDLRQKSQHSLVDVEALKNDRKIFELCKLLSDPSAYPKIRVDAAEALGNIKSEQSTRALVVALRDPEFAVREQAVFSLDRLLDAEAVDGLVEAIRGYSWDNELLIYCVCTLTDIAVANHMQDQKIVDVLLQVVNESINDLNGCKARTCRAYDFAAHALGNIGDQRAVDGLLAWLKFMDVPFGPTHEVFGALGKLGGEKAVDALIDMLTKHKDPVLRSTLIARLVYTAETLGKIGNQKAVDALIACLDEYLPSRLSLPNAAAEALGNIGDVRAVEPLVELLYSSDEKTKQTVVKALGKIHDERAVGPLVSLMMNIDSENGLIGGEKTRSLAALALAKIGAVSVVEFMQNTLEYEESLQYPQSRHYELIRALHLALDVLRGKQPPSTVQLDCERHWVKKDVETKVNEIIKRGDVLFGLCRYERALDCYNEACDREPNMPLVWQRCGDVLLKLGRSAEAYVAFAIYNRMKMATQIFY